MVKERESARIVARKRKSKSSLGKRSRRWKDPPDDLERFRETVSLIVGSASVRTPGGGKIEA